MSEMLDPGLLIFHFRDEHSFAIIRKVIEGSSWIGEVGGWVALTAGKKQFLPLVRFRLVQCVNAICGWPGFQLAPG